MSTPLLEVEDLRVQLPTEEGIVRAVDGVSYTVERGRCLGIVGESGAGKSVSAMAVMGLTRFSRARIAGAVRFEGRDLLTASDDELRRLRGNDIAMVFQDALSSLHPYFRVGDQIAGAVRAHQQIARRRARERAAEILALVGVPDPRRSMAAYPHELSGGMRQRAMIAMGLVNEPKLLIADEPTAALDVTVQAQILELLQRLRRELSTAVVLITHDLGVVAQMADEIAVMYAGRIVERAPAATLLAAPEHPYTWGLLQSIPHPSAEGQSDLVPIAGRPPSLIHPPSGCSFHPRCPYAREVHRRVDPRLEPVPDDGAAHRVACLLPVEMRRRMWRALRGGADPRQARTLADEEGAR